MESRFSLNFGGRLVEFERPAVMAIINVTPDSFYQGARRAGIADIDRAIDEGADILDIGAYSTRPGAPNVDVEEEWRRLKPALEAARRPGVPPVPVSVDTFRAEIARRALSEGADMINDVSGGMADSMMDETVARAAAPYVIMHMRGTPATMQSLTDYADCGGVVAGVIAFLARRISELAEKGVHDVVVDPGFGFAKTVGQNYELLRALPLVAETLKRPLLAGLSRKSMFYKPAGLTPADVLPATCGANLTALQGGASILRVHDVAAARQIVDLHCRLRM